MSFLKWHYRNAFKYFLKILENFFAFIIHYFSIPLLLRTLFWRFRRMDLSEKRPCLHLDVWFGNLVENFVSRLIGFIARSFVIFLGVITLIFYSLAAFLAIVFYLICPLVTLPFYFKVKRGDRIKVSNIEDFFNSSYGRFFLDKIGVSYGRLVHSPLQVAGPSSTPLNAQPPFSQGTCGLDRELMTNPNETAVGVSSDSISSAPDTRSAKLPNECFIGERSELFLYLCETWEPLKKHLKDSNISKEDIEKVVLWYKKTHSFKEKLLRFWDMENLLRIGSIGSVLSFGFTNFLDQFCIDVTNNYQRRSFYNLYGRRAQLKQLEESLLQDNEKSITILTGVKGVGKHSLIYNLAEKIDLHHVPLKLRGKRVLMLNTETFLSAFSKDVVPARFIEMLEEGGKAGNVIVVVDAMEKLLSSKVGVDLFSVFTKAKNYVFPPLIGVMEISYFNEICASNDILNDIFSVVKIEETNSEDTLSVLEDFADEIFYREKVVVTYKALKEMINLADKFLLNEPKPERAIAVFNRVLASASASDLKIVTEVLVKETVAKMVGVPVIGEKKESETLLNLEKLLHARIIDQEPAITMLSKALRRVRTGVSAAKRPAGAFLFLGPTGVGKTETAKALADIYFGSEKYLMRFDMAEYQGEDALDRLIGSFKIEKPGILTSTIKNNPFGVLLLDEIEKSTGDALNLFLTVLDEGYITDAFGNKVSAENLIIIATSNAGAEYIRSYLKEKNPPEKLSGELTEFVLKERIFSPEFINRFDAVVVYKPLSGEEITLVVDLMLKKLANKIKSEKGIVVQYNSNLKKEIIEKGYDPVFGGRSVRRYIQDEVEDQIAREILEKSLKAGDEIEI